MSSAVLGITALVASLAGSAASAAKNEQNEDKLERQKNQFIADYNTDFYRSALESEGGKAYLKRLKSTMDKRNIALDNSTVRTGATHENTLAQRQANNEVMSNAMAQMVQGEQARRDNVRDRYINRISSIDAAQMQNNAQQASNWSQIASSIGGALNQIGAAYSDENKKEEEE